MNNYYASKKSEIVMLETKEHDCRYTFYTSPVKESNISNKIVGYQCVIEYSQKYFNGSSRSMRFVSKEYGNRLYKELIEKGLERVSVPSFA